MENRTLPPELIREILLRLPVRSVSRCKCVCKSWLSVISDPQFGNSHYDLAAAPSHRLILRSKDCSLLLQSVDTEAPLDTSSAALHWLPPLQSRPRMYDGLLKVKIFGSCRGFILLYYEISHDVLIWNPLTRARKLLLRLEDWWISRFLYGFGYDTSTDDYLLIMIRFYCENYIHVFSLKTNSRNKDTIDIDVPYIMNSCYSRIGSLFNEALHWLVFSKDRIPVIIAFDLIQRSLSEIPLSDHLTKKKYKMFSLRVVGGCIGVCCSVLDRTTTEIWVMKEYKVHSSWTKSFVIPIYGFSPICITKDGGILGSNSKGRLEKLNDKGKLLEHFSCVAATADKHYYCADPDQQSAMYRESQLSFLMSLGGTSEDDQQKKN